MNKKQYIIVVEGFKDSLLGGLERLKKEHPSFSSAVYVHLTAKSQPASHHEEVIRESTDFSDDSLRSIMKKYQDDTVGVLCRGDVYVQYLRKLLPYLSDTIPVASDSALEIATNKRLMRESFLRRAPEITPNFVKVSGSDATVLETIIRELDFPVIIKPASLASSILIQKCVDELELKNHLQETLAKIQSIYVQEGRTEAPEVIVEEFLVGDFYSIDSYVMKSGEVYHNPIVAYLPAESMDINDFFLYKRWLPATVSDDDEREAQMTVEKAIAAAGLLASGVHAELIKTSKGWRVIEIGPRIGRFRNLMYQSACGIDHGYNDMLVHLDIVPDVTPKFQGGAIAYSIYPEKEGLLEQITGLDAMMDYEKYIVYKNVNQDAIGTYVKHAKNGGHALAEVIFASKDAKELEGVIHYFEEHVKAIVR